MMKQMFLITLGFFSLCLLVALGSENFLDGLDNNSKEQWRRVIAKKAELTDGLFSNIVFYGKVLDQDNNPVSNAKILIGIEIYSPNPILFFSDNRTDTCHTDMNGVFLYKNRGRKISVTVLPPDGYTYDYQFIKTFNDRFYYAQMPGESKVPLHKPDKDDPVILRVRKKDPVVLSVDFSHEIRGMQPDKDYYGDMFYQPNWRQKATPDDLTKINPEKFYPQVKVHQTYRKENETTHIFTLDVEFLGSFQFQKGENDILILPEKGYDSKHFHVAYKVVNCTMPTRNEYYFLSDEKKWIPCKQATFILFAKSENNHYGKVTLFWSPTRYLREDPCMHLGIKYRFNTEPEKRVFEDDSALRREIGLKRREELKEKIQNDFIKTHKSLSEILELEKESPQK